MKQVVLVDIDGTLSDDRWRSPKPDDISWDEFHSAAWRDTPHQHIVNMINYLRLMGNIYYIIALTTRPEKFRKMTMNWLCDNSILIDEMYMRPANDFSKSPELKVAMAKQAITPPDKIVLVLDNRPDVIEAFNALGVTTMLVNAR